MIIVLHRCSQKICFNDLNIVIFACAKYHVLKTGNKSTYVIIIIIITMIMKHRKLGLKQVNLQYL